MTDGIARSQPALSLAQGLLRRAGRHDLPGPDPVTAPRDAMALGELLLAVVSAAEQAGLDAEAALRAAGGRYAVLLRAAKSDPPTSSGRLGTIRNQMITKCNDLAVIRYITGPTRR